MADAAKPSDSGCGLCGSSQAVCQVRGTAWLLSHVWQLWTSPGSMSQHHMPFLWENGAQCGRVPGEAEDLCLLWSQGAPHAPVPHCPPGHQLPVFKQDNLPDCLNTNPMEEGNPHPNPSHPQASPPIGALAQPPLPPSPCPTTPNLPHPNLPALHLPHSNLPAPTYPTSTYFPPTYPTLTHLPSTHPTSTSHPLLFPNSHPVIAPSTWSNPPISPRQSPQRTPGRWGVRLSLGLKQSLKSNILSNQDTMETNISSSKVLDDLEQRIGSPVKKLVHRMEIPLFSGVGILLQTPT